MQNEIQLQRDYYTRVAANYDKVHLDGEAGHDLACSLLASLIAHHGYTSVLDVGSGTGRAVARLSRLLPGGRILGVEPVEALRRVGHAKGIPPEQLIEGDGTRLTFADGAFDVVCEFGVLHHVREPRRVVTEMLRVARHAIFISDSNRFAQGAYPARLLKRGLWKLGLLKTVGFLKTRGAGYTFTEGDGVAYSYSVFDDYSYIAANCERLMISTVTGDEVRNPVLGAPHVALFGMKK